MSNTKYAYAVARIRVLENKLLDRGKINRMVEAESAREALKILSETDYGQLTAQIDGAHKYESVLEEELKNVYLLVAGMAPEPEVMGLFSFKYDFHNLKVLLKAKFLGQDAGELLYHMGTIPADRMKLMVEESSYRDFPPVMRAAAEEIEDIFSIQPQPQKIDLLLDKAMFKELITRADRLGNKFLKQLFLIEIDLNNLRALLRIKKMGGDSRLLQQVFIPGGSLGKDFFENSLTDSVENIVDKLAVSNYGNLIEQAAGEYLKTGKLSRLEKLSDDYMLNFIREKKHNPFGVEPLIGYITAKENEVKNIRIIMAGKINKIPADLIRERLRDTYA